MELFAAASEVCSTAHASVILATAAWTAACCALAACMALAQQPRSPSTARIQPTPLSYVRHVTQAGAYAARKYRKRGADTV